MRFFRFIVLHCRHKWKTCAIHAYKQTQKNELNAIKFFLSKLNEELIVAFIKLLTYLFRFNTSMYCLAEWVFRFFSLNSSELRLSLSLSLGDFSNFIRPKPLQVRTILCRGELKEMWKNRPPRISPMRLNSKSMFSELTSITMRTLFHKMKKCSWIQRNSDIRG